MKWLIGVPCLHWLPFFNLLSHQSVFPGGLSVLGSDYTVIRDHAIGHNNRSRSVHASLGSIVNEKGWARVGFSDEVSFTFKCGQTMVALL